MPVEVWCRSDRGLRRTTNQDSFLINRDIGLYAVADGMGGHQGGEVASALAVKTVEDIIKSQAMGVPPRDLLANAYMQASQRIFSKAATENPELVGMGTTMVLLLAKDPTIYIGNVGDSRAYLFSRPNLWQVTEDHSLVNEQVRAGLLSEEQALTFTAKNVITRSVGYEKEVVVDVLERTMRRGDLYLLCSDGLTGLVSDERIGEILNENEPKLAVDLLIDAALAGGGDDNVTVMLVAVT